MFSTNLFAAVSAKIDIFTMKKTDERKNVPLSKWKKMIWSS